MHIDMNSYFASVEQQANPFLRGKPVGVTGKRQTRSVIAAASIEAKKLGAKTAMASWQAKRLVPKLILVPGDSAKYSHITSQFLDIFHEFTDEVEQFSIDEAFLDVTFAAKDYMGATIMAQMIKARLKEECGERITCSIGIGPNKLIAKLASEFEKPDGLIVVKPKDVPRLLELVELEDICGIGPRIARRLNMLGVYTIKQLQKCPLEKLVNEFKSYGFWLHNAAYGRDDVLVGRDSLPARLLPGKAVKTLDALSSFALLRRATEDRPGVCPSETHNALTGVTPTHLKSMGHSYTLPRDTHDPLEMKRYLLGLADKVGWRLRKDGYVSRQIATYVRYGDFTGTGQIKRFSEPTADGLRLFQVAWSLIKKIRDPTKPVRLLGLSAGRLSRGAEQIPLFPKDQKMRGMISALDQVQARFGNHAWTRASLLNVEFKERSSGFHYDCWN